MTLEEAQAEISRLQGVATTLETENKGFKTNQVIQENKSWLSKQNIKPTFQDMVLKNMEGVAEADKAKFIADLKASTPEVFNPANTNIHAGLGNKIPQKTAKELREEQNDIAKTDQVLMNAGIGF